MGLSLQLPFSMLKLPSLSNDESNGKEKVRVKQWYDLLNDEKQLCSQQNNFGNSKLKVLTTT